MRWGVDKHCLSDRVNANLNGVVRNIQILCGGAMSDIGRSEARLIYLLLSRNLIRVFTRTVSERR